MRSNKFLHRGVMPCSQGIDWLVASSFLLDFFVALKYHSAPSKLWHPQPFHSRENFRQLVGGTFCYLHLTVWCRLWGGGGVLGDLTKDNGGQIVGGVPPAVWGGMGIPSKLFFNITRHTNVNIPCLIIPFQFYAAIKAACPVDYLV